MKRLPWRSARAISTIWRCSTRQVAGVDGRRRRRAPSRRAPRSSLAQLAPADHAERARGWSLRKRFSPTVRSGMIVELLIDAGDPRAPGARGRQGRRRLAGEAGSRRHPARSRPVSRRTSVDLPAPLRPTRATRLAGRDIDSETSSSACVAPKRLMTPTRLDQRHGSAGRPPGARHVPSRRHGALTAGVRLLRPGCPRGPGRRRSAW